MLTFQKIECSIYDFSTVYVCLAFRWCRFNLLSKTFLGNKVILMNIEIYSKFYTDLYIMSSRDLRRKFELDD